MKLENGDSFERKHAGWIRENIPSYEEVWAAYIGCDDDCVPCTMPGITDEQENNRKRFYQAHHSFVAKFMRVRNGARAFADDLGEVTDATMEDATERLFDLMTAVGYVRDMFKIMDESLSAGGRLYASLQRFYAERSHVIHGPRLPFRIDDGLIMIPNVGGENALNTQWTNRSAWDQIPGDEFVYVHDFVKDLDRDLHEAVVAQHGKIYNAADSYFDGARIAADCANGGKESFSGATASHIVSPSGVVPPDGPVGLSGLSGLGPK